jgi:hypothetical protein
MVVAACIGGGFRDLTTIKENDAVKRQTSRLDHQDRETAMLSDTWFLGLVVGATACFMAVMLFASVSDRDSDPPGAE